ncbi:hypothetical protein WME79_12590 [Sorangium sp. So ce726]|uniref:hypothetical protein n=1 Tax=Sorangium sp. So ce726 TaxID=3133319 RepID=UPI003F63FE2B
MRGSACAPEKRRSGARWDLEFHHLDLGYEELRSRIPARERRLFSSLAEVGQQAPIVVVNPASSERPAVIDGYKRVRLFRRLGQDMVRALGEADALLLERMLRAGDADNALDLGWFRASCGSDSASAARS